MLLCKCECDSNKSQNNFAIRDAKRNEKPTHNYLERLQAPDTDLACQREMHNNYYVDFLFYSMLVLPMLFFASRSFNWFHDGGEL